MSEEQRRRRTSTPLPIPQAADRLPPHSIEAEQGILGCVLLDPQMGMQILADRLPPEVFYDLRHQALFDVIKEMHNRLMLIDLITIQQYLKDRNQLDALGGMPYIASLMNYVPSAANLEYYVAIVLEKYTLRRVIQVCTRAIGKVYECTGQFDSLVTEIQGDIMSIDPKMKVVESETTMGQLMDKVQERIDDYARPASKSRGLSTGYEDLDRVTNGGKKGQLWILAARPSIGKSSLAMNIVESIAMTNQEPCGIFSLEMEAEEYGERMVSSQAGINGDDIQRGELDSDQLWTAAKAIQDLRKAPIYIYDKGGITLGQFRTKLRQWATQYKIRFAVVDYLQLFHLPGKENRSIEIGAITTAMKALAKELGITLLVLSQLNRDLEKENRRPRLSDLRDSGSIEQDADKVILLSEETQKTEPKKKTSKAKEHVEEDESDYDPDNPIVLCEIAKNRGAKKGFVRLRFRKPFTRFESISRVPTQGEF